MTERDPFTDLRSLAQYGEDRASVPSAEHVRAWGARRRRRRHTAVAALVLVSAVLTGGAVVSQSRIFTDSSPDPAKTPIISVVPSPSRPTPSSSGTSSVSPSRPRTPDATSSLPAMSPPLRTANLPTAFDLEFHQPNDWTVSGTTVGAGRDPVSRCITTELTVLEPLASFSRTYDLVTDGSATALVLELGDENQVAAAYDTLTAWVDDCAATLRSQGYTRVDVDEKWDKVRVQGGEAKTKIVSSAELGKPDADGSLFEEIGLTRVGTRIAVVSFRTTGQDYNFSRQADDPTGLPLFPMMRSLPKVAERLSR
jgi:hypothetical protein